VLCDYIVFPYPFVLVYASFYIQITMCSVSFSISRDNSICTLGLIHRSVYSLSKWGEESLSWFVFLRLPESHGPQSPCSTAAWTHRNLANFCGVCRSLNVAIRRNFAAHKENLRTMGYGQTGASALPFF
jgi:hypothetical protein